MKPPSDTDALSLATCESGSPHRVTGVHGGCELRLRLRNLGLAEGTIVAKTHTHPFRGPVTVRVQHTEIAIGRGMACHILVEKVT